MVTTKDLENLLNAGQIPFIKGFPGTAKSATAAEIARSNNWLYIDVRLSQKDEVDISGLPTFAEYKGVKMADYALPNWFVKAHTESENGRGVLVHFEEINRTTLPVRNACLEILNERTLNGIKLNENVRFIVSGNLGEEDGTEVDEMDSAVINRIVPLKFEMPFKRWYDDYAKDHVHPLILEYLQSNETKLYDIAGKNSTHGSYASPRSWTNMSNFLKAFVSNDCQDSGVVFKYLKDEIGIGFIGNTFADFRTFVSKLIRYDLMHVLSNWTTMGAQVKKAPKSAKMDLSRQVQLSTRDTISGLTEAQTLALIDFMKSLDAEDCYAVFAHVIQTFNGKRENIKDSVQGKVFEAFKDLAKRFKEELNKSKKK